MLHQLGHPIGTHPCVPPTSTGRPAQLCNTSASACRHRLASHSGRAAPNSGRPSPCPLATASPCSSLIRKTGIRLQRVPEGMAQVQQSARVPVSSLFVRRDNPRLGLSTEAMYRMVAAPRHRPRRTSFGRWLSHQSKNTGSSIKPIFHHFGETRGRVRAAAAVASVSGINDAPATAGGTRPPDSSPLRC
jgi:hypothetical protein